MRTPEDILNEILSLNSELESIQKDINSLVHEYRNMEPTDDDHLEYRDSIESYFDDWVDRDSIESYFDDWVDRNC